MAQLVCHFSYVVFARFVMVTRLARGAGLAAAESKERGGGNYIPRALNAIRAIRCC